MITPRHSDPDFTEDEPSKSSFSIEDIQFWIDHPSLDDLTAAQSEPDRQHVRKDVEECIRLLRRPINRVAPSLAKQSESGPGELSSGRYTVIKLLGVGAFGVVLQAMDRLLHREVAVKILRPSILVSKRARMRFTMEVEALARCDFEGIVPIYEVGEVEGNPYMVMGLIQGSTLAEFLRDQKTPVDPQFAARLIASIANTVHRAHQRGILHRDLKPSNILLDTTNQPPSDLPFAPFVSDFGLAKDLVGGSGTTRDASFDSPIIGTVRYMSPEQATGRSSEISVTSDVFSLGVILYQLLTLHYPFQGKTTYEITCEVANKQEVSVRQFNANISRDLDAIVRRCLSKIPSCRYQSAGELAEDLSRFLEGKPVFAKPAGSFRSTYYWIKRNPSLAAALSMIGIGLIVGSTALTWLYRENLHSLRIAEESALREEKSRQFALHSIDQAFRYTAEKILQNVPQSLPLKLELHQKGLVISREYAKLRDFDEESMHRLSIAHHLVSCDAENCMMNDLAVHHRQECIEIVMKLAEEHPKNPAYQFDLFTSYLLLQRGNRTFAEHLPILEQARSHLLRAMELDPGNPDFEDADAAVCSQFATHLGEVDREQSKEYFLLSIRKSLDLGRKFPGKPHYYKHAIRGYETLAVRAGESKDWKLSLEYSLLAREIVEKHFSKSVDVRDVLYFRANVLEALATALEHIDPERGLEAFQQLIAATQAAEKHETTFAYFQLHRSGGHLGQARIYKRLGNLQASQSAARAAQEALVGYVPSNEFYASERERLMKECAELGWPEPR